jgi:hypothetical protein
MSRRPGVLAAAFAALVLLGGVSLSSCSTTTRKGPAATAVVSEPVRAARSVTCGTRQCRAGAEICCLGEPPACVPIPPALAAKRGGDTADTDADALWRACDREDFALCDDAGDCGERETCCRQRLLESDGLTVAYDSCVPLRGGKVACEYGERCSDDDTSCLRAGAICGAAAGPAGRECSVPRAARGRPTCPKDPCPDGAVCVMSESGLECAPASTAVAEGDELVRGVVECWWGRECPEDQSCYRNPMRPGTRCDYGLAGVDAFTEPALCAANEDCRAFCRHAPSYVPHCYVNDQETGDSFCECLPACTKDADCTNCDPILTMRQAFGATAQPYCDATMKACDCR